MIQRFLQYLQYEKNCSSHTVFAYQSDILQFCQFMEMSSEYFRYEDITSLDIQHWIMALMEKKMSARTISRKISSLKSFWRFLQNQEITKKNPTSKLVLPKTNKPLPAFYKDKEMRAVLLECPKSDYFESVRNLLIISMLYQTGLRVSELISLKDLSLDLKNGQLKVVGKRNKERIIPIGTQLVEMIEEYIVCRDNEVPRENHYLLVRKNGLPMYREAVYGIVRVAMKHVSTLHKQSPHVLRHTFATALLNNGADINAVKDLLGHQSLAATQAYTDVSFSELNKIYKQAHPRAIRKGGKV